MVASLALDQLREASGGVAGWAADNASDKSGEEDGSGELHGD